MKRHGLARWLSKYGLMSRTEAERCVAGGRVALNGKVVTDPERAAHPELDRILLDGRPLRPARRIYLAMHKPEGYITTAHDPAGRPTACDLLPPNAQRVQAVVFSQWVRMHEVLVRRLERRSWRHVLFHGGVESAKRTDLIDRFRDDPDCRAFLSTDAGAWA